MGKSEFETGEALDEQVAEDARLVAWLVEGTRDYECVGAEAAAEFGL
jgi:hypothetical protein